MHYLYINNSTHNILHQLYMYNMHDSSYITQLSIWAIYQQESNNITLVDSEI